MALRPSAGSTPAAPSQPGLLPALLQSLLQPLLQPLLDANSLNTRNVLHMLLLFDFTQFVPKGQSLRLRQLEHPIDEPIQFDHFLAVVAQLIQPPGQPQLPGLALGRVVPRLLRLKVRHDNCGEWVLALFHRLHRF